MEMDRTGMGCVQRVTTIKRGAERHRGEREREGEEINLLIFHGQPVVITVFGALRAFRVGQFECMHMCVCVKEERWIELHYQDLGDPPTPTPHTPLCPCLTAQSYNSHYHKDTLSSDRRRH